MNRLPPHPIPDAPDPPGHSRTRTLGALLLLAVLATLSTTMFPSGRRAPAGDLVRTPDGAPGTGYWQQRVDYRLEVELVPEEERIDAAGVITYRNHSPEPLDTIWLQLEQERFRPANVEATAARTLGIGAHTMVGAGYEPLSVEVKTLDRWRRAETRLRGTRMKVSLPSSLGSGEVVELRFRFGFRVPGNGLGRMGIWWNGSLRVFQLAQWYPRPFVYDDARGWNVAPYLGQGEFYLEFGDFDVRITAPAGWIVAGTGTLENGEEILGEERQRRLEKAIEGRARFRTTAGEQPRRASGRRRVTWHYRARRVRDFVWAASDGFIWEATAPRQGVLVQALYPRAGIGTEAEPGWEAVLDRLIVSIEHFERFLGPYPYSSLTAIAGTAPGTEYPMVQFGSVETRGRSLEEIVAHEVGHMWFPMLVGSDERSHAWMDEGLVTFLSMLPSANDPSRHLTSRRFGPSWSRTIADTLTHPLVDQAIMTPADELRPSTYTMLAYDQPATAFSLLREKILGPATFDRALREYVRRWRDRHPRSRDLFDTFESVSGEPLGWFWDVWFRQPLEPDHAVDSVTSDQESSTILLSASDGYFMPVDLLAVNADGRRHERRLPSAGWSRADGLMRVTIRGCVVEVRINPGGDLPDINPANDLWKGAAARCHPISNESLRGDSPGGTADAAPPARMVRQ